jgi:hypothetical protein
VRFVSEYCVFIEKRTVELYVGIEIEFLFCFERYN